MTSFTHNDVDLPAGHQLGVDKDSLMTINPLGVSIETNFDHDSHFREAFQEYLSPASITSVFQWLLILAWIPKTEQLQQMLSTLP